MVLFPCEAKLLSEFSSCPNHFFPQCISETEVCSAQSLETENDQSFGLLGGVNKGKTCIPCT